jgi:hypothetical protein
MDAPAKQADGRLVMGTPPDSKTGVMSIEMASNRIRSHGFTASRPISPIRDVIVKDFMVPIPIAAGFPQYLQMAKTTPCRQRFPSWTIRIAPGKPAALFSLSWLIPPGFLLPLEIEMTIKNSKG